MELNELQAEISLLLKEMDRQPEDQRELYIKLQEKINEIRAFGMPVPDDLKRLERALNAELIAESQGR